IAKNNHEFLIEANYKIASYYKIHGQYENALKIDKEIPNDYKNIKMLKENKKFNKEVNRLKTTNNVRNDFEIWQQIAKYENKNLSAIAKKTINEHINIRRRNKQIIEQLKWD
ncbi:16841_t:CDS:2, partial [Gigaspora margarita]